MSLSNSRKDIRWFEAGFFPPLLFTIKSLLLRGHLVGFSVWSRRRWCCIQNTSQVLTRAPALTYWVLNRPPPLVADRVIRCKGEASPLLPWPVEGSAESDTDGGDDDSLAGVEWRGPAGLPLRFGAKFGLSGSRCVARLYILCPAMCI